MAQKVAGYLADGLIGSHIWLYLSQWLKCNFTVDAFFAHITIDYDGDAAVIRPKTYAGTDDLGDQIGIDSSKDPKDPKNLLL
ncbi:uncharacterized protein F4812DRAFT_454247 [Daldinia caldariorum]|uniref:uncharacterized protein n=1 Tax=Daldinia caldariorum TaxID=326644 RepID=UPI0020083A57|nr:uncharacterized protein F4812DRAFT_454247 [Daldinia caldariorum]KAI1472432.1 hypothetical protein F4812DRAFT_454247 [Daldinia caldariorum]